MKILLECVKRWRARLLDMQKGNGYKSLSIHIKYTSKKTANCYLSDAYKIYGGLFNFIIQYNYMQPH